MEDLVPALIQSGGAYQREIYAGTFGNQSYSVHRYRPRIEGLFARIERWCSIATGDTFWKAVSKDNKTSFYGTDSSSRIADPNDASRVFSWLLALSCDDRGNVVLYEYKPEDRSNVPDAVYEQNHEVTANRYIKRILYGNLTPYVPSEDSPLPENWCFEVVFDYGEHDVTTPSPTEKTLWRCRPDAFSSYRSCFEVRTYRLCSRVLMFHHFPQELNAQDYLVRSTNFQYSCDNRPSDPLSPIYTYLESVTQSGFARQSESEPYMRASFPPVQFDYTKVAVDKTVQFGNVASLENVPSGIDGTRYQWTDLDGEGSPGILTEQTNAWFYKRNVSNLPDDGGVRARFEPFRIRRNKTIFNGPAQRPTHGFGGRRAPLPR